MKTNAILPLFPLILMTALTGCKDENTVLHVYAASSLTATLNQIKTKFEEKNSNIEIRYNFNASGKLQTQIEEGGDCDIFFSAAPKQMNALITKGFVVQDDSKDLLENKVTLVVPDGNPSNVTSFDNLIERLVAHEEGFKLAIGEADVPVGDYTRKIFNYYEHQESEFTSNLTYCANVSVVATTVKEAGASCGTVYQTDAFSYGLSIIDRATKDMCGQVIYPAAILKNSTKRSTAEAFFNYLKGDEAMEIFASVGFSKL